MDLTETRSTPSLASKFPNLVLQSQRLSSSRMREFDPSVSSHPVTRPRIVVNLCAKTLHFTGISYVLDRSPIVENRQLQRESPESLQANPQKFPFRGDFRWRQISIALRGRAGSWIRPSFLDSFPIFLNRLSQGVRVADERKSSARQLQNAQIRFYKLDAGRLLTENSI